MKTLENFAVFCFQGVEKGWIANEWVNPTSLDKEWITDGNNSDRIVGIFIDSITVHENSISYQSFSFVVHFSENP